MITLKKIQNNFQSFILENNNAITDHIVSSQTLSPTQRLQIYQNGYYARFIVAMQQDFPRLCDALGESAFASLVRDYIDHHPSQHFNLRYIGKYLSKFILEKDKSFIAYSDLAKLEYVQHEIE